MRGSRASRDPHDVCAAAGVRQGIDTCAAGSAAPALPMRRPGAASRDARLQMSRRADWRFLLPDARLGHVALLGDEDPELADALRLFGASLSFLDLGWRFPSGEEPRFDLVVLRSRHRADARRASALVEPGGCLYWEIERRRGAAGGSRLARWRRLLRPRGTPLRLGAVRSQLEKLGFTAIQFHWHRPDFRAPLEIVPLDDAALLRYVLDDHGGPLRRSGPRLAGRLLRRAALLQFVVPCLSVVGCRSRGPSEAA